MTTPEHLTDFCLPGTVSIHDCMQKINANRRGIVLIVDSDGKLIDTITDGDIRRAILSKIDVSSPVSLLITRKAEQQKTPLTTTPQTPHSEIASYLEKKNLRQMPIVNEDGTLTDLVFYTDLLRAKGQQETQTRAVVMAGGFGTRLHPLTDNLPKPLLPVGDQPLISRIVNGLKDAEIQNVSVTTHFLPEKIKEHLGDGTDIGLDINYIHEDMPQGTAGGLRKLLEESDEEHLLVINGDILTTVDFQSMIAYHTEHNADITMAVLPYDVTIPYGVVSIEGSHITSIVEKPTETYFVNAGIYVLKRETLSLIPETGRTDMTDLIATLFVDKKTVVSFPVHEYWRDIGKHEDYERAQEEIHNVGRRD